MKTLMAGNWKMNGTLESAQNLILGIINGIREDKVLLDRNDFLVCPPFLHIDAVRHSLQSIDYVALGAQDCALSGDGAFTGDVSAAMLADSSCSYVITGHSERRQYHSETSVMVADKTRIAHSKGLTAIVCIGETDAERAAGRHFDIVAEQLEQSLPEDCNASNTVIAYEPVWAIGTGKSATAGDIGQMHGFIRDKLKRCMADYDFVRILYGGSVKPANAAEILAAGNVNGALIGGASLDAAQFLGIAKQNLARAA